MRLMDELRREHGIPDRPDLHPPAAIHDAAAQQLFLGFPEPPRRHGRQGHPTSRLGCR
jgi:hypothetical protein